MEANDLRVLTYIREFIAEHGYSPSYREIAHDLDLKSTRTVSRLLEGLREEGKVEWTPQRRRTLRLVE